MGCRFKVVGLGACALALCLPHSAGAVLCDELPLPNKLYGVGHNALTPILEEVARRLEQDPKRTDERTTVLYVDSLGACGSYQAFLDGKVTGRFFYWTEEPYTFELCDARDGGQPLDFAYLPAAVDYCSQLPLPADVVARRGLVHGVSLVTGLQSPERSISAEALYLIYGFGPDGQASPWTDGSGIFAAEGFNRDVLGFAIGVPPERFHDDTPPTIGTTFHHVMGYASDATRATQAIGFASLAAVDAQRSNVKPLAYQHFGQDCGVWPDSNDSAFDKLNVRLGKYALWQQGSFLARVNAQSNVVNDHVANFMGWFDGSSQPPGTEVDVFPAVIEEGGLPDCAMQASREGSVGSLSSYAPPKPCGCAFEALANPHDPNPCHPCSSDSECGGDAPRCNFGFCEGYRAAAASEG